MVDLKFLNKIKTSGVIFIINREHNTRLRLHELLYYYLCHTHSCTHALMHQRSHTCTPTHSHARARSRMHTLTHASSSIINLFLVTTQPFLGDLTGMLLFHLVAQELP